MMLTKKLLQTFLVLVTLLGASSEAWGHYNLRTTPGALSAGMPFTVSFDDDECEIFLLEEPGVPPAIVIQGSTVRVEVDRAPVIDCSSAASTYTIPVQGLPAGNYTLQLIGRVFESPGTEGLLQTVALQIAEPVSAAPAKIPATEGVSLMLLGLLVAAGAWLAGRSWAL